VREGREGGREGVYVPLMKVSEERMYGVQKEEEEEEELKV